MTPYLACKDIITDFKTLLLVLLTHIKVLLHQAWIFVPKNHMEMYKNEFNGFLEEIYV